MELKESAEMVNNEALTDELDNQQLAWDLQINLDRIIEENTQLAKKVQLDQLIPFIYQIQQARRIFIVAAGRSGFTMQSAAMRLMHLGLTVYYVGDTTSPAIGVDDLLIAASGSGSTGAVVKAVEKSVSVGANVVGITTNAESPLAKLCNHLVLVPAAEKEDHSKKVSAQYAGSLFEQFLLLLNDAVFQSLWKLSGQPAEELWKRHANLE
ncbi:6-phospho-3-hexuloisomerase [Pedobacter sp. W3I1]|uniref:6-phospho-3-hexuloisomerase n=1 Tax=Pedobacter sp. W3I1 TaxID=3042291 RepID=UPI00278A9B22|nr:6-phospho-3-hexuloisomerase [Pedobacter sp. W3I1]MDQ0641026.1 6-phospho-3-hexuloisomerase [Pedobacter sp. W3I1]